MNNFDSNEVQISVGKQIKYIRKKNNLTQANLAHLSGMEEMHYNELKQGELIQQLKPYSKSPRL